jgi:hypothetical protein
LEAGVTERRMTKRVRWAAEQQALIAMVDWLGSDQLEEEDVGY